jgi:hypothetical protein
MGLAQVEIQRLIATGNLLIRSTGIRSIGTSQPSKDIRTGLLYEMTDGKRPDKWTRHLLNLCSFIPGEGHCNFAIARGVRHRPIAIVG